MESKRRHSLAPLNTFGIDVVADRYVGFDSEREIREFLQCRSLKGSAYLVLGGGSNLLFTGDFCGTVLHPRFKGISIVRESQGHVWVKVMAGEIWDDLVAAAVAGGWGGIENLSLIPGSVGASVVQNIGAYGVEVETMVDRVEAIDLGSGERVVFRADECAFGYRTSRFKGNGRDRFIITAVVLRLDRQPRFILDYPGVRAAVAALGPVSLENVRRGIIDIRQRKLPDPAKIGNAGSFFKNPVVERPVLQKLLGRHPDLPHYAQADGRFKLAAGWLIDRCGWKGRRWGRAGVHENQALVLVNRGGATGREILALSDQIRRSVFDTFEIRLEREVRVAGTAE